VLAVSLLTLCLVNADSMVALQRSGCLQQLLGHITDSTSTEMKRNAVRREEGRKEEGRNGSILSMFNKSFILQAKALAKAARNGECMVLAHTPSHLTPPHTPCIQL